MKRNFLSVPVLCFSALLFLACSQLLNTENQNTDTKGIVLTLPYGKSNKAGVFRAGNDADTRAALRFNVTFLFEESGEETVFEAMSGETILFEDVVVGNYIISVLGYNDENVLLYQGEAPAEVKEDELTVVTIKLQKVQINEETEPEIIEINLLSHTDEQAGMIAKYIEAHPECGIHLNYKVVETTNGKYTNYLDSALKEKSNDFIPDIYTAEAAFVLRYTKGEMSGYALPYNEFISNVDSKISDAEIAKYTVDVGTNASGNVVGLAYQTTGGAFIYRRSVAKQVFGSDDPKVIKDSIGGDSGSWTKFWEAAEACGNKGVAIVSGDEDLWHPVEGSADSGWIVDGKLHIDSKREAFFDYSKKLLTNGWSNKTTQWTEAWYKDVQNKGEKPVLGFFGPAWLINFVIEPNCENDTDWAMCESPVGFFWGGTWMFANKKLKDDTSAEGKNKLEAVQKLLEWITLDASDDGFQYQWANGLLGNAKDTVASSAVMNRSNGKLDLLGGQNMFDYYIPANKNARADLLTEYDDVITALWRYEVNKYAEGLNTKEQALSNFIYSVYSQLGIKCDNFDYSDFIYETEHVKAESAPDGKGIKFTLTAKEGENWNSGSSFIWESVTGTGIRISDVPTPGNPKVCYWPLTEDGVGYEFNCKLNIAPGKYIEEKVVAIANGGNEVLECEGENVDLTLSGTKIFLSKDLTFSVNKSKNVKPYFAFDVYTTNETRGENLWNVEWKQWLNSGQLEYSDEMIKTLQNGYQVLNLTTEVYSKLKEDKYYFANLTLEFTIDGYPESFRSYAGAYSEIVKADFDNLATNKSEHITAEPDPDGKGIKFTISAKDGEEWRNEWFQITDVNKGIYMQVQDKIPEPGKPLVCYWPLTKNGESYIFDCEVKLKGDDGNIIHEVVSSTAKGNYASVNLPYDALDNLDIEVDSSKGTVKVSKDLSSDIKCSNNVTATYDFGTFSNDSASDYKWTNWISSRFQPINDSSLYGSGAGVSVFDFDRGTVEKLTKDRYYFVEMSLNFEIEGIADRFRYSNGYKSKICDSTTILTSIYSNKHITVEPDLESFRGVKITLRHLENEGEWGSGNTIICLAEDGQDGVNIELFSKSNFTDNVIPEDLQGNRCPTAEEPEVTYIYPFTKPGEYEFVLAGPLDTDQWQSEYVRCVAAGGLGELIDYDKWNNDVKVTDIVADAENKDFSFKVQGDVASIIDNSSGVFSRAVFCPDVRAGVEGKDEVAHRGKTFGYASRRVILVGDVGNYNRGPEALGERFVIENNPEYEAGTLPEDAYDNEDVFEVLANWNNKFYVIMSIQEIRLASNPNMRFHLHWK